MQKKKKPVLSPHRARSTSAKLGAKRRKLPHNSNLPAGESSAKFTRMKKTSKSLLTRFGEERGRRQKIPHSTVSGRAYNKTLILTQQKDNLDWDRLRRAKTVEDLKQAFGKFPPQYLENEFHDFPLILKVVADPKFPKGRQDRQIQFLAESLAGGGFVSPRRARDICAKERKAAKRKEEHRILRREFYIECSCGYKGVSREQNCPKCDARDREPLWGSLPEANLFPPG